MLNRFSFNETAFTIPALTSDNNSYIGPTGPLDANDLCKCNTVVYSLTSACAACQGNNWVSCVRPFLLALSCVYQRNYDHDFVGGTPGRKTALPSILHKRLSESALVSRFCFALLTMSDWLFLRFSNIVPDGTRVQEWAFIDVTVSFVPTCRELTDGMT
jgi:hypothetical protein